MRWTVWIAVAAALAACKSGNTEPKPQPNAQPPATPSTAAKPRPNPAPDTHPRIDWVKDLDYLARELPRRHINAFHTVTKRQFEQAVASLRKRLPSLDDDQALVELSRLVARIGDGHTALQRTKITYLQLGLYWFADGIYVRFAPRGHAWAVGRKLTAVGGVPIDRVIAKLTGLIARDNAMQLRQQMANYLIDGTVLHGVGLSKHADRAVYTLAAADGKARDLTVALGQTLQPSQATAVPLYRQRKRAFYWRTRVAASNTMYVQYNRCADAPNLAFAAFTRDLLAAVDKRRPVRLVIDLRFNAGGNSAVFDPLLAGLAKRPWLTKRGKLFAIIGRATFSSAVLNTMALKLKLGAVLVGEPSGGKPNHYGEVKSFTLPSSGHRVTYSTKLFHPYPGVDAKSIVPDVKAELRYADYAAGKDPAMAAILAYRR